MSKLPKGWLQVAFEDVAEINPRKSVDLKPNETVTFVPMAAVNEVSGTIVEGVSRPLQEVNRGYTQFANGDVIFAKITPSMENGKSAVAIGLENGIGFGSTEFHVFRSSGAVLPEYLWRFVRQKTFREDAQKVMSGAVGQQRVPAEYLRAHPLPLPPIAEQKRIAAKIDGLTSRTARARTDLDYIPALVEKYKSRILDLAFTGKLTEDFRGGPSAQVSRKEGIPEGWAVKSLGDISEIQGGVQVGKKRALPAELVEIPYLRVANVQRGWLNLDEIKTIAVTLAEKKRLLLQTGDILMNEGGDRDKLGRGWVWGGQIAECIHQNHVFRIRLKDKSLPAEFVSHYANEKGQQYFIDQGTQTTNLASISKRKVAALPVPVPPSDEAVEIVSRIETAFTWIDRISAEHAAASSLLPKLDAAILSKAFRGELVAQDPNDEPASNLLGRIRAEYEKAPKPKRVQKVKLRKAPTTMVRNLEDVLAEAGDWLPAQEAFRRCGIADGSETDAIEVLYAELRLLDKTGRLEVNPVTDEKGRKLHDRLKLKAA